MNNRNLLFVFVALLSFYLATKFYGGKQDRSFKSELVRVDTAAVDKILLYPKTDNGAEVRLERKGGTWTVSQGTKQEVALDNVVESVLNDLVFIKAQRVAAKTKAKWADYELDEAGTKSRIKVYAGEQLLGDFYLGRFSFDPNTRAATSFIRLEEGEKVYAVEGLLSMNLAKSFVAFRDRTVVKLDPAAIQQIDFTYADNTSARYLRQEQAWTLEGAGLVDASLVNEYLQALTNLSGISFKDDFNPVNASETPERVVFDGPSLERPISVDIYKTADEDNPYVVHSSLNQDAFLQGNLETVYAKLMKTATDFQPQQ